MFASFVGYYFSDYGVYVNSVSHNNFILFVFALIGLIFLSAARPNFDFMVKMYKYISWLLIFFFIYQVLCTFFLYIEPILPFSFLERLQETERNGVLGYSDYYRFSSVFSEPSHFAQYLSPLSVFYLYGYKDIIKQSYRKAIYVSLAILFCISGTGIAILGIIWGCYVLQNIKKFNAKHFFFLFVVGSVFLIIFLNSIGMMTMVNDMTDSNNNKTLDRVTRGFYLFADLPIVKQIFGLGYQCISASSKIYQMRYADVISNGHNEYLSDITSLLITGGIIGFVYIVYILKRIFVYKSKIAILMTLVVLGVMSSESTLGSLMMFYICMIFATLQISNRNDGSTENFNNSTRLQYR